MMNIFIRMVDANMIAGWVRAFVATLFGVVATGGWEKILTPDVQTSVTVILVTVAVGLWSTIAKAISPPSA